MKVAENVGIFLVLRRKTGILVKPIHPKEEIQIVLKRYLEKIVLHYYKKQQKKR